MVRLEVDTMPYDYENLIVKYLVLVIILVVMLTYPFMTICESYIIFIAVIIDIVLIVSFKL